MIRKTIKYRNLVKLIKKKTNSGDHQTVILALLDYICELDERIATLERRDDDGRNQDERNV